MVTRKTRFSADEMTLLAAIHASPRDDSMRLIYADWLEENGQAAYAEFIRLQCSRARAIGIRDFLRDKEVSLRESALLSTHRNTWSRPLTRETVSSGFIRGLPLVGFRTGPWHSDFADKALKRVSIRARFALGFTPWVESNLTHEILRRTATITMGTPTEEGIRKVAACPYLSGIERILMRTPSQELQPLCDELLAPRVPIHTVFPHR